MWVRRVGATVLALTYAPDGRTLYTVEGGRVSAWDIASRAPTRLFHLPYPAGTNTRSLDVIGGRYLRVGLPDPPVWDLEDGRLLAATEVKGRGAPVDPATTELRFISPDGALIRSCDLLTGTARTLVRKPRGMGRLRLFAFTPDDRKVAFVDAMHRCALVTVSTGESVELVLPLNRWVHDIRFAHTGRLTWMFDNGIHVSDVDALHDPCVHVRCRPTVFELHPTAPMCAALDGDDRLTLFDLLSGAALRTFDLDLGTRLRRAAFAPNGLTGAIAGTNRFAVFDVDL
jgi:hypothetical protein